MASEGRPGSYTLVAICLHCLRCLPLTSCVAFLKELTSLGLHFLFCKLGLLVATRSVGEDPVRQCT